MKLIDKAAVVAEIEKKLDKHNKLQSFNYGAVKDLESLLNFLDTLEVREVREESVSKDLEEAAFDYAEACKYDGGEKLLCVEHFKAGAQWQKQQNTLEVKEVDLTDKKSDWRPSKKQIESLGALVRYNIGVFDYQKLNEVAILYDDLTKI